MFEGRGVFLITQVACATASVVLFKALGKRGVERFEHYGVRFVGYLIAMAWLTRLSFWLCWAHFLIGMDGYLVDSVTVAIWEHILCISRFLKFEFHTFESLVSVCVSV